MRRFSESEAPTTLIMKSIFPVKRGDWVGIKWTRMERSEFFIRSSRTFCKEAKIAWRNGSNICGRSISSKAASSQIRSIAENALKESVAQRATSSCKRFGQITRPLQSVTKVERIDPTVLWMKLEWFALPESKFTRGPLIPLINSSTCASSKQSTEALSLFLSKRPARPRAGSLLCVSKTKMYAK